MIIFYFKLQVTKFIVSLLNFKIRFTLCSLEMINMFIQPNILNTNSSEIFYSTSTVTCIIKSYFQEHKTKLLMFTALVATICLVSSVLAILVRVHRGSSPSRLTQDLDTVSSELSVDLQLHELGSVSAASCQTLLPHRPEPFKPKGILKNSKTSENFRFVTIVT